ncbi:transmembrane protein 198 [Anthonomus grandis grandis]|uniref:transmembrane protein 198 n=1 Tax=Anthonomus grandis grandis TaxID=2921223 RepID=UPI002165D59E|nr:transmembrane protein 198 [Anthonomus grandis grandis]
MANQAQPGSLVPPRNGSIGGGAAPPHFDRPHMDPSCTVSVHYNPIIATIFGCYIVIGLVYTFAGYRLFKTIMFLTGFIFACSMVYLMCLQGELLPSYGNAAVAAFAGLLFGLITMLVQYVGLFVTGLHTGLLFGLAGLLTADYLTHTTPKGNIWLCIGVLLGSALLCAIFSLYFRKGLTIVGSSLYGGALLAITIDYFLENLSVLSWIWQRASLKPVQAPPCWFSWIVLGSWPILTITGIIVQSFLTGRGRRHEDVAAGRKKPANLAGNSARPMNRLNRAELRQKKYRYLYQVRTAHGDIISQNFVQQMQNKKYDGECSTLESDATHLTMLPDHHNLVGPSREQYFDDNDFYYKK